MSADSNYSQQPVPLAARKSALALSVVMLGLTFFSASMWTGGTLGTGLSYDDFFLAVLLGNLMLGLYTAILGFIGARTGLSTHLLAHYSFGSKGSWLPSALLGGTQVGWFGVGVAMFAIPVAKATGLDVNLLILVSGALMTLTVFFGIAGLTLLSAIAVPAILVLGLNIWTTNDNALYASGLGFANITGLSSRFLAMLNGALGTLAALWLYNHFVGWLTFLSAAIPPIGGVIIADYLSRRRRYRQHPCADIQAINWAAILAVACGTAAGHWLPGIVPVNAVLGAAIAYLLLNPLLSRSPNKPEEVLHAD